MSDSSSPASSPLWRTALFPTATGAAAMPEGIDPGTHPLTVNDREVSVLEIGRQTMLAADFAWLGDGS